MADITLDNAQHKCRNDAIGTLKEWKAHLEHEVVEHRKRHRRKTRVATQNVIFRCRRA